MLTTRKQMKWLTQTGITKWYDSATIVDTAIHAATPSGRMAA